MQAARCVLASLIAVLICVNVAFAQSEEARVNFDVPARDAEGAVKELANQARRPVLFRAENIADVRTNAVTGSFTISEALGVLFSKTPLQGDLTEKGAITVSLRRKQEAEEGTKMKKQNGFMKSLLAGAAAIATGSGANAAQDSEDQTTSAATDNIIVVSARKKDESDLNVPIAMQILDGRQLERFGVQSLQDVAAITPSLNIASNSGNSGGTITLRGIGTPPAGPGTDQAVALNLDGVTIAEGTAVRLAQFDLERVEILQGPQSLYFGKNSSGGIISVVSADPTDEPYAMLRGGYTFESRGWLTEAVLSGPLAEGLGARLAFFRSDQEGYFKNPLATTTATPTADQIALFGPLPEASSKRAPEEVNTGVRLTLKYEPTDALSMRVKGAYAKQSGTDSFAPMQLFYCPAGVPDPTSLGNISGVGDCELDDNVNPIGRNIDAEQGGDPLYRDGQPYAETRQYLASGNIDYRVAEGLTLSSITSYYDLEHNAAEIVTATPYPLLGSTVTIGRDDFQQELRLTTDFDSPLNGMFGAYYQSGELFSTVSAAFAGSPLPTPYYIVDSRAWAVFGQLTYSLFDDRIEISAGGRYTDEKKDLTFFSGTLDMFVQDLLAVDSIRSKKFSPEATVSYRPNDRTNIFVTYKKGTKSGGFNLSALQPPPYDGLDISFADESAEGFEGGVKTVLLDGALRVDLTGYGYTYKDLQVSAFDPVLAITATRNAASAKIRGVQFNASYAPQEIPGFNLMGTINYGHARFESYLASCYIGQTISEGCIYDAAGDVVATGAVSQDLSGRQPTAAPDWTGSIKANYEFLITASETMVGLSVGANYTDDFEVVYNQPPQSKQSSSVTLDAQLRLFNDDRGWELALIGKNLTNELRVRWGIEAPLTPFGVAAGTGTAGPGVQSDLMGMTNTPRLLMLRLTVKPFDMLGR